MLSQVDGYVAILPAVLGQGSRCDEQSTQKILGFSHAGRSNGAEDQRLGRQCCPSKLKPPSVALQNLNRQVTYEDIGLQGRKKVDEFNPIKPIASILIPVFNKPDELMSMLDSYSSQDVSGLISEVIIIDDASTDNRVENVIKSFKVRCTTKVITMRNATNQGFARSVNMAFKESKGDILVVCNSDIVLKENSLVNLLARFNDKMLGAAGCLHLRYGDKSLDHTGVVVSRDAKIVHNKTIALNSGDWAFSGALFAVRGVVFKSLGGFDEQFVNGGEDVDLCIRIRKYGFKIAVVKECVIEHHVGASRGVNVARDEANSFALYKKWEEDIRASCEMSWKREFHYISQIESIMGYRVELIDDINSVVSFLSKNYVAREMDRWHRMFCGQEMTIELLYYKNNSTKNVHTIDLAFESSEAICNFYVCGICKTKNIYVDLLFDRMTKNSFFTSVSNYNFGVINPISNGGRYHEAVIKIYGERDDFEISHLVINDTIINPPQKIRKCSSFLVKILFCKFLRKHSE